MLDIIFNVGGAVTCKPYITRKVLHENEFNYSILENSRNKLQEYAIKYMGFHLRN